MNNSMNTCNHGVPKEQWISIPKTSIGYLKYTGCIKCIKEQKREDDIDSWKFMGQMFGICFAIMGMIFFWISPLVYGFQWWNILGAIVCTGICCLPMYLEYKDNGKIDLRPRFMK